MRQPGMNRWQLAMCRLRRSMPRSTAQSSRNSRSGAQHARSDCSRAASSGSFQAAHQAGSARARPADRSARLAESARRPRWKRQPSSCSRAVRALRKPAVTHVRVRAALALGHPELHARRRGGHGVGLRTRLDAPREREPALHFVEGEHFTGQHHLVLGEQGPVWAPDAGLERDLTAHPGREMLGRGEDAPYGLGAGLDVDGKRDIGGMPPRFPGSRPRCVRSSIALGWWWVHVRTGCGCRGARGPVL